MSKITVEPIYSKNFIIALGIEGNEYAIFDIFFNKNNHGVYINFPYYEHTEGIVCKPKWPKGKVNFDLELTPYAKITSHLVKYSHYPDGNAHFSQDGKVFTKVKRKAVRLNDINGHLFTVTIHGLESFKKKNKVKIKNNKDLMITMWAHNAIASQSFKIVGRIYNKKDIGKFLKGDDKVVKHCINTFSPNGKKNTAPLLSLNEQLNYLILLTCEKLDNFTSTGKSTLIFLGGFDPKHIIDNYKKKETENLILVYPFRGGDELKSKLESIDFK